MANYQPDCCNNNTSRASVAGQRSTAIGIIANLILAAIKATAGIIGNSYALIADAIESSADVLSSICVYFGLKMARKPADESHPYGHGKFEPIASVVVACALFLAAILIATFSIKEIITPHHAPAPFTLVVLVLVIVVKETLFRHLVDVSENIESNALKAEAWHHRSDAITSLAAFFGISIAIIGGPGYESSDDFAALLAAGIIATNAVLILKPAVFELTDAAPDPELITQIRAIAESTAEVSGTHKCFVRKLGFDYFVDLDILCDPDATIRHGHDIAHNVADAIRLALPKVCKVLVHVEPAERQKLRS